MGENKYLTKVQERWQFIGKREPLEDLELELEFYKKIFNIFQVGKSYFFVFSPPLNKIERVSASIKDVIGYDSQTFTIEQMLRIIHPDDLPTFVDFETAVVDFKIKLPVDKLMKYKSQYNYRIRTKSGKYIKILQQSVTIQCDDDGAVWRNLAIHTDISEFKTNNEMRLSFIGLDGEPSFNNVKVPRLNTAENAGLTAREMEILLLLIKDRDTTEIADLLCISRETVKTHRKHIHTKLGTSSTLQLVLKAMDMGWI